MNLEQHKSVAEVLAQEIQRQAKDQVDKLDWRPLCRLAGCSRRHVDRIFREYHFTSPARYLADLRTQKAEALLAGGHDVLSAAAQAGFSGPGRLHDALVTRRGVTPGEYRQRGAGVRIAYGQFDTPLGLVVIAATQRGVCAIRLCTIKSGKEHVDDIRAEFPRSEMVEDAPALQHYADQLVAFLEARAAAFHPDLDVQGTTFQREVWAELRRTQPGEVLSYTELARRVGRPGAVRAVARACATNPVAIAVPCHRVVRKTGDLAGYAWGLEWKARLQGLEKRMREKARV